MSLPRPYQVRTRHIKHCGRRWLAFRTGIAGSIVEKVIAQQLQAQAGDGTVLVVQVLEGMKSSVESREQRDPVLANTGNRGMRMIVQTVQSISDMVELGGVKQRA